MYRIIGIFEGTLSIMILYIHISLFRDIEKIKVFSIEYIRAIIGGIVDDHCHIVGVILSEDRIQVVF